LLQSVPLDERTQVPSGGIETHAGAEKLAAQGSAGCQGKYLLLKAEQVSLNTRSSTGDLLEAYKKAAEMTVGWRESLIDEGLAHERAASAFMERDEGVRARPLCFHGKR